MFRWEKVGTVLLHAKRNYCLLIRLIIRFWRWNFASEIVPCLPHPLIWFHFPLKHLAYKLIFGCSCSYWTEKAMAPHSSTLAWRIPWTEEPGRLQSMESLRVGTTERLHFHFSLSCIGEGNGNPLQYSCLENPRDGGAWWAAIYGVAQSWTRLKRLSSSSSSGYWKWV